jgi:hypothetical protein
MKLNFYAIAMLDANLHLQNQLKNTNKRENLKWHIATKPKAEFCNLKG